MIEKAMKELHFSVKPNRTAKQQVSFISLLSLILYFSTFFFHDYKSSSVLILFGLSCLQSLEVIKSLKDVMPIERAQMRLKLYLPVKEGKKIKEKLAKLWSNMESDEFSDQHLIIVSPHHLNGFQLSTNAVNKSLI
jgi:ribosome maturation protein SDO1